LESRISTSLPPGTGTTTKRNIYRLDITSSTTFHGQTISILSSNTEQKSKSATMATTDPTTLPSPPFFNVPNIINLRDAALFPLRTPTGPVRPGILFRSADVSKLTLPDWQALSTLGIRHVFDLRSMPEVQKGWAGIVGDASDGSADVTPGWVQAMQQAGVQRSWVPVFAEHDYSPERLAQRYAKYMDEDVRGFVEAYRDILQNGGPAYRDIFVYLAGLPGPGQEGAGDACGALIHCSAGKDRTGMFFALLLSFLGVDRADIAKEYNLTEQGLVSMREEVVGRLLQSTGFQQYMRSLMAGRALSKDEMTEIVRAEGTGEAEVAVEVPAEIRQKAREAALRMMGARTESMLQSLDMLEKQWGSAEGYMRKECGLGDEDLHKLRRNLIVEE
jgi:protein tyrosine/serine phosphatase